MVVSPLRAALLQLILYNQNMWRELKAIFVAGINLVFAAYCCLVTWLIGSQPPVETELLTTSEWAHAVIVQFITIFAYGCAVTFVVFGINTFLFYIAGEKSYVKQAIRLTCVTGALIFFSATLSSIQLFIAKPHFY